MGYIKVIGSLLLSLVICHRSQAQDGTAVQLEQLAALKGYISTAERGYRIVEEGLHLARDLKSGEFNLHRVFFSSLKIVDDAVLGYPELRESYRQLNVMHAMFARAIEAYGVSGWLRPDELAYVKDLEGNVTFKGEADRDVLRLLAQDGVLSMTDGERIRATASIGAEIRRRNVQVGRFLAGVAWLIAQRQKDNAFTGTLKKWYDL